MSGINSIHDQAQALAVNPNAPKPLGKCLTLGKLFNLSECKSHHVAKQAQFYCTLHGWLHGWKEMWGSPVQLVGSFTPVSAVITGNVTTPTKHGADTVNNGWGEPAKVLPGLSQWYGPPKVSPNSWFVKIRWVEVLFKFTTEGKGREQRWKRKTPIRDLNTVFSKGPCSAIDSLWALYKPTGPAT